MFEYYCLTTNIYAALNQHDAVVFENFGLNSWKILDIIDNYYKLYCFIIFLGYNSVYFDFNQERFEETPVKG